MGDVIYHGPKQHTDHVLEKVCSASGAAHSWLIASWARCQKLHRLSPETAHVPEPLDQYGLASLSDEAGLFLHIAEPVLDRLFKAVGDSGCCVLLTNAAGIVLTERKASADEHYFEECGLRPGANWSEAAQGTNGIGTCLAERRSLTIRQTEHFRSCNTELSCIDAPIFDGQGNIVAALNVSTCRSDVTAAALKLLALAVDDSAARIESDLFRSAHAGHRVLVCDSVAGGRGGLLAIDSDDLVVGASRSARKAYGLTDDGLNSGLPALDVLSGERRKSDLDSAERSEIKRALARADGNATAAARDLGIGRATLYRRMQRLGIT
ncbi:MAG: GAF domain-containing protein [Pseudomonadota bacterium]